MADLMSVEKRSYVMSRIRSIGNETTETALIRIFRSHGVSGWRRRSTLSGRPDFIFPHRKIAVFADGCFWHGCPRHFRMPTTNREYWSEKISGNRSRDRRVSQRLRRSGWAVWRLWECTIRRGTLPQRLLKQLLDPTASCQTWLSFIGLSRAGVKDRIDELLDALYEGPLARKQAGSSRCRGDDQDALRVIERLELPDLAQGPQRVGVGRKTGGVARRMEWLRQHGLRYCRRNEPRCDSCPLISFCATGVRIIRTQERSGKLAIDLFAGAGAFSSAFRREGVSLLAAVERERYAAQSYRFNNPGTPVLERDVRAIRASGLLTAFNKKSGEIPLILAGPPCQGYSAAGNRRPSAPANYLYTSVARIAAGVGAEALVMENVPGLRAVRGVDFEHRILAKFERAGFTPSCLDVDASRFGVPQKRPRLFFVGLSRNRGAGLKLRPRAARRTVAQVLRGLPALAPGGGGHTMVRNGKVFNNHQAMAHSRKVVEKIRCIERGTGPISYRRLPLGLTGTLIAGHRALPVHPRQHRTISVREAARIQTLPDTFRFLGPHHVQPLQVANAVPYLLGRAVARALRRALDPPS